MFDEKVPTTSGFITFIMIEQIPYERKADAILDIKNLFNEYAPFTITFTCANTHNPPKEHIADINGSKVYG